MCDFKEDMDPAGTPENANLAHSVTMAYSWRGSVPWRIITELFTFKVPDGAPGVFITAQPKPETEEWVEWVEPYYESEPVVMRVRAKAAIFAQKFVAESRGHAYADDQTALDDFMAVNWATIVRYPKG